MRTLGEIFFSSDPDGRSGSFEMPIMDEQARMEASYEELLFGETLGGKEYVRGQRIVELMDGLPDEAMGVRQQLMELKNRVEDEDLVDSPEDGRIAEWVASELVLGGNNETLEWDLVEERLSGLLEQYVPKWVVVGGKQYRQIRGLRLGSVAERRIKSRLTAREHDIGAVDGSWGSKPAEVRRTIASEHGITLKVTQQCTSVGSDCSGYCPIAEVGEIRDKVSFESAVGVIGDFVRNGTGGENDVFYSDTDIADIRWAELDEGGKIVPGTERDAWHLFREYYKLAGLTRFSYHSSAMLAMSELRMLRFTLGLLRLQQMLPTEERSRFFHRMRFSENDVNAGVLVEMKRIIECLEEVRGQLVRPYASQDGLPSQSKIWKVQGNRSQRHFLSGDRWMNQEGDLFDSIGIGCGDQVTVGPAAVEMDVMRVNSRTSPQGRYVEVLAEMEGEEGPEYRVPLRVQRIADRHDYGQELLPERAEIVISKNGRGWREAEVVAVRDPLRAALRLAMFVQRWYQGPQVNDEDGLGYDLLGQLKQVVINGPLYDDVVQVQEYLRQVRTEGVWVDYGGKTGRVLVNDDPTLEMILQKVGIGVDEQLVLVGEIIDD